MTISVSPLAYGLATALAAVLAAVLCVGARLRPGPWRFATARLLGVVLLGEQVSWQIQFLTHHDWSIHVSLPFDLCDFTCFVAAAAAWTLRPVFVELTWFWGLAGTLQGIITPDIETPWPHLSFDNYVVEHLGIVVTALFLVIGLGIYPRRGAIAKVFGLTLAYAALCAVVNVAVHADYLYLRSPPPTVSLLNSLGPWPWYLVSCTGIALVSFAILDAPFWPSRRSAQTRRSKELPPSPVR